MIGSGATRSAPKIRHLIVFVLCLMYFIAYIDRVNISVAGPTLRKELGLTPIDLGLIFSAFAYPYAAMQIVGGWMSCDKMIYPGRAPAMMRCATTLEPGRFQSSGSTSHKMTL